jgi:hypothetical protein
LRTIWLSTSKICNGSSFAFVIAPTIISPLSMRACFLAATSSILSFEFQIQWPWSSRQLFYFFNSFQAFSVISFVKLST